MDLGTFWELVELIDQIILEEGYGEESVQPLIDALSLLSESDIKDFETQLTDALYELDGQIYMDNSGENSYSGDGFLYCRCYVVAKGRKYYENVLNNPENMPATSDQWCEALLYVAEHAWLEKTNTEWDFFPEKSHETGSNTDNW